MKAITKKELKEMDTIALSQVINELNEDTGKFMPTGAKKYAAELASRMDITPMQAVFLACIMDMYYDNNIRTRDIASHFNKRPLSVFNHIEDINTLVNQGFIVRRNNDDGETSYRMPSLVLKEIANGNKPKPENVENLEVQEFLDFVSKYLNARGRNELDDEELSNKLTELIDKNQQLVVARKLKSYNLLLRDLVMFLALSMLYINNHDEHVMRHDIEGLFQLLVLRAQIRQLENGTHILMKNNLVCNACNDGHAAPNAWTITDYAKKEVFGELNLQTNINPRANLKLHEEISAKEMFYPKNVTSQVSQLESMLESSRMERIMNRLSDHGMRKGFSCLFYGSPGTGKTETVMQLARLTKRDIMLVDVPSIRSKWVGETEKNIKAVFERYRKLAHGNSNAPILLFNEADALFNRRNTSSERSVDKMENAMQNIILQEMENLEGILIATTNLTDNLDNAFERRFLYKIEFEKPTANERQHIWKAMLGDLTDEQAFTLAQRYEFSGGQIENIARKRIINDILSDRDTIDIDSIVESCDNELLNKENAHIRVGF